MPTPVFVVARRAQTHALPAYSPRIFVDKQSHRSRLRPGYGTLLNENRQKMDVEKRRRSCKKIKNSYPSDGVYEQRQSRNCARSLRWLQSYFETIKTFRINERREVMQIFTLISNHFGVAMVADDCCQTVSCRCRPMSSTATASLDLCLRTWAIIAAQNNIITKIAVKSISIENRCTCLHFHFFFSLSFVL